MMDGTGQRRQISTELAAHDVEHIWIRGLDLTEDIMGTMTFTEVIYLAICGRRPTAEERGVLDAVLVALVEHGLTPSAAVARLTSQLTPESIQGAVAAGLLGVGGVVLGSMEEAALLLSRIDEDEGQAPLEERVEREVEAWLADHQRVPGIGHVVHTRGDPRARRLGEIAVAAGLDTRHLAAMESVSQVAGERAKRKLPVNVTGASAAVLLELGVPWDLQRGFALIARVPGLVAHIAEERDRPITPAVRAILRGEGEA